MKNISGAAGKFISCVAALIYFGFALHSAATAFGLVSPMRYEPWFLTIVFTVAALFFVDYRHREM